MRIECECGCVYEIALEEGVCDITAKLVECPMCFREETEESCTDTVNDTGLLMDVVSKVKIPKGRFQVNKTDKIKYPYKKRPSVFSDEANKIIKNNYQEKIDLDLVYLINDELDEKYTYNQVKARRKQMGFFKERGRAKIHSEIQSKYNGYSVMGVMHFNRNGRYLCKPNLNTRAEKLTKEESEITCDNCKRRLEKEIEENESEPTSRDDFNSRQGEINQKDKSKRKGMSEEVIELIEENYMEKTDGELRELIADKFGAFHATDKIEAYRETNGMGRPQGWIPPEEIEEEED